MPDEVRFGAGVGIVWSVGGAVVTTAGACIGELDWDCIALVWHSMDAFCLLGCLAACMGLAEDWNLSSWLVGAESLWKVVVVVLVGMSSSMMTFT